MFCRMRILDPKEPFLQKWNKILILSCVIAVSLDPLFFYIPVIDGRRNCLGMDKKLAIATSVLRSFFDMFYLLRIIFQFRTGYIVPPSQVFGTGRLVDNPVAIARRYLSSYFIVDILSILPLPQVALLGVIPKLKRPVSVVTKKSLMFLVLAQYVPRLIRIYSLYENITRSSGIVTETAWAGATSNFCLYMLASHVVGAIWYLLSIERKVRCWRDACWKVKCDDKYLYCGEGYNAFLNASCPLIGPDEIKDSTVFNFGIFIDSLQSGVVESRNFHLKFSYCFWWGLRSLSSLGQNLKTSTFIGEIYFAVFISAFGLVLFSLLIGNMQKYLMSTTASVDSKAEEMRLKRRDLENWMSHRMLPEDLKERIRRYEQYKWQETRGVEEETLIQNLPKDLRRELKHHLCSKLLLGRDRVPMFDVMDDQLLGAMFDRLKPVLYAEKSFITYEGDPVDEMLFITGGNLLTTTTNGGKTEFFCGYELLAWALDPNSSSILPTSTRTVQAQTEVEAFSLKPDDLKFVVSQFRPHFGQHVQDAFRTRAEEDKRQEALAREAGTSSPRLGTTI